MLQNILLEVVNKKLKAKDPPQTKETLDRLMREGYSEEKAKELIAAVVAAHIYEGMKNQEEFNETKYVADLKKLPQLPLQ